MTQARFLLTIRGLDRGSGASQTAKSALKDEAVTGTLRRATGWEHEQYAGAFKYSAKAHKQPFVSRRVYCAPAKRERHKANSVSLHANVLQ